MLKIMFDSIQKYLKDIIFILIIVGLVFYILKAKDPRIDALEARNKVLIDSNVVLRHQNDSIELSKLENYKKIDSVNREIEKRDRRIDDLLSQKKLGSAKVYNYNDSDLTNYYKNYFKKHETDSILNH